MMRLYGFEKEQMNEGAKERKSEGVLSYEC